MTQQPAKAWVVAGPPGAGKSTVAKALLQHLSPTPALLDKDTMYCRFVAATLQAANRPMGEREGNWYDEHIKVHEYGGITDVAREIRLNGCAVLLCAPFTKHVHDLPTWNDWVEQLGGGEVQLIWVCSDAETLRHRLQSRNSERDTEKLANFEAFIESMHLEKEPIVDHITIDNRLSAPRSISEQI